MTFTAPLTSRATYSTTVPVPSKSDSPPSTVSGPAGDHSRCDQSRNIWELLFGGIINGCPPADVGIRGGLTPIPIPPPGWTGGWDNPFPLPTGPPGPDDPTATGTKTSTDSSSTTTSETSTSSCALQTPVYDLPDDPENSDFDNLGADPNIRRRYEAVPLTVHGVEHNDDKIQELVNITLHARASARRQFSIHEHVHQFLISITSRHRSEPLRNKGLIAIGCLPWCCKVLSNRPFFQDHNTTRRGDSIRKTEYPGSRHDYAS